MPSQSAHDIDLSPEDRMRATLDSLLDPHIVLRAKRDEQGKVVDFIYVDANPPAFEYNQSTPEEMLGRTVLEIFPGHTASGLLDMYTSVVETGEPLVLDDFSYLHDPSGTLRWYDVRAVLVGRDLISYTWRDVTERHLRQLAVSEALERFRLLTENTSDFVLRLDANGKIEWASDGTSTLLGIAPTDLYSRNVTDVVHLKDRESMGADVEATARAEGDSNRLSRIRILTCAGVPIWVNARLSKFNDADDKQVIALSISDIRGQVEQDEEQALHRRRKEFERSLVVADQVRLARELQDTVVQDLFASSLSLSAASQRTDDELARSTMIDVSSRIEQAISRLRSTIFDYSRTGGELPCSVQLQAIADELTRRTGMAVTVEFVGDIDALESDPARACETALRSMLEELASIDRASECRVEVVVVGGELCLSVTHHGPDGSQAAGERLATGGAGATLRIEAESRGGSFETLEDSQGWSGATWKVPVAHV